MSILKQGELNGFAYALLASSIYSDRCTEEACSRIAEACQGTFQGKNDLDIKIIIEGIEVDVVPWLKGLHASIEDGYTRRVAHDVRESLMGRSGEVTNRLYELTRTIEDIVSEAEDRATRVLREVSEEAYWTTSASQNC